MTGPEQIPDAAVEAYRRGEDECAGAGTDRGGRFHDDRCCERAGLAAALPYLAEALHDEPLCSHETGQPPATTPDGP